MNIEFDILKKLPCQKRLNLHISQRISHLIETAKMYEKYLLILIRNQKHHLMYSNNFLVVASATTVHLVGNFLCRPDVHCKSVVSTEI